MSHDMIVTIATVGAVFVCFIFMVLAARGHKPDERRGVGRDKFYSQQGYARDDRREDRNNNPTIIVIHDGEKSTKKKNDIEIINEPDEANKVEKMFGKPSVASNNTTYHDPLKTLFGVPTRKKTFFDSFTDTSPIEKIFGKPKSNNKD